MIVPFPFICVIRYHKDSVCFEWCFKFRFKATLGRHFFLLKCLYQARNVSGHVSDVDFASFYDFDIGFWNCSGSSIFLFICLILLPTRRL